jgi:hypothetical protein
MVIGPALILVNKWILVDLGFHYPLAVSSLGLIATALSSHVLVTGLEMASDLQSASASSFHLFIFLS